MRKFVIISLISLLTLVSVSSLFGKDKDAVFNSKGNAIKGYDTVAYFTEGKAVKGSAKYQSKYHGFTWQFSSKKHKDLFDKDPKKYLPQYNGYCAYGIGEGGYLAPIDPTAFTVDNGKLYLNYNHSISKKWKKNKAGYIKKGDATWKSKYKNLHVK